MIAADGIETVWQARKLDFLISGALVTNPEVLRSNRAIYSGAPFPVAAAMWLAVRRLGNALQTRTDGDGRPYQVQTVGPVLDHLSDARPLPSEDAAREALAEARRRFLADGWVEIPVDAEDPDWTGIDA